MNDTSKSWNSERPGAAPKEKTTRRGLWLLAFALAALLLTTFKMGASLVDAALGADQQGESAKPWMARWPARLGALSAFGESSCPAGPAEQCVIIEATTTDLAGNSRAAKIWAWPAQNWVRAWVPFDQWRLAHEVALKAEQSQYGRMLLKAGAQEDSVVIGTRNDANEVGESSKLIGFIDPAAPDGASRYKDDAQAEPPFRMNSQSGPVAEFADGLRLPARMDSGHWMILAQGPADQAPRLAAALLGEPDPGAIILPAQAPRARLDKVTATPPRAHKAAWAAIGAESVGRD